MISLVSQSVTDTHGIAAAIAGVIRGGDIVLLSGEMGAGKTAFTTGFARGLGVADDEPVSSPTFTLTHTHQSGRLPMVHADLFRLGSTGEVADLGLREQADMGAVVLVEWGDVVADAFGDALLVELVADDDDDNMRNITVVAHGPRWVSRWESLKRALAPWSDAP